MTAFALRPARPEDEAAVTALFQRSYSVLMAPDYEPGVLAHALPLIARANPKLLTCPTFYLVEARDGALLGCGGWTPEKPGNGGADGVSGHIRHFATDPTAIRQGVGRAILERCLADARAQGFQRLECFSSLSAVPFYAAFGFRTVAPLDIPLSDGCHFPSQHMICDL